MVIQLLIRFLCLLLLPWQAHGVLTLTADEQAALDKLGVSAGEVRDQVLSGDLTPLKEELDQARERLSSGGDASSLKAELEQRRDNLSARADEVRDNVEGTVRERLEQEKKKLERAKDELVDDVMGDAEDVGAGYAASTISLITLAVMAPQVVLVCKTKPSALAYAGTGAIYLIRELRNSMKFRAKALSEIEYVELRLDSSKSVGHNLGVAKEAVNLQFELLQRYKGFLDEAVESIEEKAKSAKMASYGFLAASAIAAAETFAFDAGACLDSVVYQESLPSRSLMSFLISALVADAIARSPEITVKKHELSPELKSRVAKYAMDMDKILALVAGGASFAAAQFFPSYNQMLKKMVSNGTARSIIFAAHGGIAMAASHFFEKSSKSLKEKLGDLQRVIDRGQEIGQDGFQFVEEKLRSNEVRDVMGRLGVNRELSDMSVKEIEEELKTRVPEEVREALPEEIEGGEELLERLQSGLMSLLINAAWAAPAKTFQLGCYDPERCAPPPFPSFKGKTLAPLNPAMASLNRYGQAVYQGASLVDAEAQLESQHQKINSYRSQVWTELNRRHQKQKGQSINFEKMVQAQEREYLQAVEGAIQSHPQVRLSKTTAPAQRQQQQIEEEGPARSQTITRTVRADFSAMDYNILMGLVERLERTVASSGSLQGESEYWPLHPKDVSLFDAIHNRHRQVLAPYFIDR